MRHFRYCAGGGGGSHGTGGQAAGAADCEPRPTADWETELFRLYDPSTLSRISFTGRGQTMVYQDGAGLHVSEGVPVPEPAAIGILVMFMAGGVLPRKRRSARTGGEGTA